MRQALDCTSYADESLHTLGVAVVVYSRKGFGSSWGHASIRAVGCRGTAPFDAEYESYVVSRANWPEISRVLSGEDVLDDESYWDDQRGRRFLFRNDDPVDLGFFQQSHAANREIYEIWLEISTHEANKMVKLLEEQLQEQLRRVREREALRGRYRALSTNCTMPMQELLERPWHLPHRWLRELESTARLRVLHPSWDLLARWGDVPATVEHPRPVFRRSRALGDLPDDVDPAPVLPLP